jgi:hypothetical protein
MGVKSALPGRFVHCQLEDGFVELWIIDTKEDIFVGGSDVLDVGLLEDCYRLMRYTISKLLRMRGLVLGGEWKTLLLGW